MAPSQRKDGGRRIPFACYVERLALLLDYRSGLSSPPVGFAVHSVAHGNILRQRSVRARRAKILRADVARTRSHRTVFGMGRRAPKRSEFLKCKFQVRWNWVVVRFQICEWTGNRADQSLQAHLSLLSKRSEQIIPPVALEWDRFALRAKRAINTLQPTQGSSRQMPQRKPAGLAGLPDRGGCRAGALEGAPGRLR